MNDYDLSLHNNPSARAWAKYFCSINPGILDEDVMTAWFANAMMAMHDHLLEIKVINGDHAQHLIDQETIKVSEK